MASRPELCLGLLAAAALGAAAAAVPAADPLAEAAAALRRGDGIAAEVAARRALDARATRDEVAAFAGEAELLQGDLVDAREWLGPGRFASRSRERGFHALARLEMAEGDLVAAADAFDRALAIRGGTAPLWADIGRLRYRGGQHSLALEAAERALAIDPMDPRALEFRAQLIRDSIGVRAALPWFERALEQAPGDLDLLGEYAATLGEAGRHREMLAVARKMVQRDPRHPRAFYLQAVLAARAGLDDLARRLLARTNGAYGDIPAGQLLAGVIELRGGNPALAVDMFDDVVRRQPDNAGAAMLLGRALLANGEANEVVGRFGGEADRTDAPPYLLTLVGRAYERLGKREDAARYLDRAAQGSRASIGVLAGNTGLSAVGPETEVSRLRALLGQGRFGEALAVATELKREYLGSMDVEMLAGDAALLAKKPEQALAAYRRAARIRRDFALVERMVAAHSLLGREDLATNLLADFLAQNPRSGQAAALLGRMRAQQADWPRARALLAHADALAGGDAWLLADRAEVELAAGETAAARDAAERSYTLQPANGRIAWVLGRVLEAGADDRAHARALLAKAQQLTAPRALARR